MKIFIGADHRGYELKEQLKVWLGELQSNESDRQQYEIEDCGNAQLDPGDDYPDFAITVGERVVRKNGLEIEEGEAKALGIVICGSGVGASIAANKVNGIRAGHAMSVEEVEHARARDQINVLSLSADYLNLDQAKQLVQTFLKTQIEGNERDQRRVTKITEYEKERENLS